MVLTRRQEQLMHTPPPGGVARLLDEAGGEASPATPAAAGLGGHGNGRAAALPLKSALKTARRRGGGGDSDGTPEGAGIKKTVRIHSSNNMVHEFQTSHSVDDSWLEGDSEALAGRAPSDDSDDGNGTPSSASPRARRPRARRGQPAPHPLSLLLFGSGPRGGSGRRAAPRRSVGDGSSRMLGVVFTLLWMVASSTLIFSNKVLMVDHGFRFPFALTALGQVSSVSMALLACQLGLFSLRPPPSLRFALTRLLPVSASFAACLFLGNVAYLGLSVAFINMLKAATPLVTLAVGLALGMEQLSLPVLLSTGLIFGGTTVATASEAATDHFNWLSFTAFAFSIVFEGIRVVLTEKLLGQARYNVMEALVYLGPFTFVLLAAGSYAFEREGLATTGWALVQARPGEFVWAAAISFLVNLFCYLAIKHVSATSFKVAGCLKNVVVVWGGILQGDVVTARELEGYAISLAGFVLFSAARMRRPAGVGHSADSAAAQPAPKKRQ